MDATVRIGGRGTACAPVVVRGEPGARPVLQADVVISGSHVILEHVEIDLSHDDQDRVTISDADHVALRHVEVHGLDVQRNTTVVFVEGSTDVVIFDAHIHDNGDFTTAGEIDVHGIGAYENERLWILDSHIHHNRGDGMQFGHRAGNTLAGFYVGGNDIHDNGENSIDIKEASDVVISGNRLHDEPLGPVVLHDCPLNAAVIDNEVFGGEYGVSMASLEDACAPHTPLDVFVLRNRFHDINGDAVQGWGTGKRYHIAGNRFERVQREINVDPVSADSNVSADEGALAAGLEAFEGAYGFAL